MDGMFVPNISFVFPLVETMRRATTLLLEAQLMIVQPDRYLNEFAQAGADVIIVHQASRQECWCGDLSLNPCERAGERNRRPGPGAGDDRQSRVWWAGVHPIHVEKNSANAELLDARNPS
jgi:hypothetical protein